MKHDSSAVLRALGYFRQDRALIFLLLVLLAASTVLGLLQAWPLALLVAVAPTEIHHNWLQNRLLSISPREGAGQIVGLALAALLLRLMQELLSTAPRASSTTAFCACAAIFTESFRRCIWIITEERPWAIPCIA